MLNQAKVQTNLEGRPSVGDRCSAIVRLLAAHPLGLEPSQIRHALGLPRTLMRDAVGRRLLVGADSPVVRLHVGERPLWVLREHAGMARAAGLARRAARREETRIRRNARQCVRRSAPQRRPPPVDADARDIDEHEVDPPIVHRLVSAALVPPVRTSAAASVWEFAGAAAC